MDDSKAGFLDERDKRMLKNIKEMVIDPFEKRMTRGLEQVKSGLGQLKSQVQKMDKKLEHVYNSLVKNDFIKPFTKSQSPREITKKGYNLLNKNNVRDYLDKHCELLKEDFKGKTDAQIFIRCSEWAQDKGKEKFTEIILSSNITMEDCNVLFSLFIMERIKKKQLKKPKKRGSSTK